MKAFKMAKLSLACQIALMGTASLMMLSPGAQAAEEQKIKKDSVDEEAVEVIEVVGFRASEQKSRDMKREAIGVVDAIIAEDIGKMPDANIAEALQRITGVSITRANGEGSQVSIRGMGPALNRISINGKTLTSSGDDQAVSLEAFDSGLLEKVEVFKTPSASMVEGSLGGSINLQTSRALDAKDMKLVFNGGAEYAELVDKASPKFSINYVDQFADRKLGFSGGINYEKRYLRQDTFSVDGYFMPTSLTGQKNGAKGGITDSAEGKLYTLPVGHPDRYINGDTTGADLGQYGAARPKSLKYGYKEKERERIGAAATFEFRPTDSMEIIFDTTYSASEEVEESHLFSAGMSYVDANTMVLNGNNTVLAGNGYISDDNGLPIANRLGSNNSTDAWKTKERENIVVGLEINHNFDTMRVSGAVGYSMTELITPESIRLKYELQDKVPFAFDTRLGDIPSLIQHGDINNSMFDADEYRVTAVTSSTDLTKDNELAALLDFDYDLDFSIFSLLEFGVRYTDRTKDRNSDEPRFTSNSDGVDSYNWNSRIGNDGVQADYPVDNFLGGVTGNTVYHWPIADLDGGLADFGLSREELKNLENSVPDPLKAYVINEKTYAGYIQANFANGDDSLVGNIGVRVVKTDTNSEGASKTNDLVEMQSFEHDFTQALPSLNLRYSFTDNTLMRFAVGRVMARPSFGEVAPKLTINYGAGNPKVKSGNPYLNPFLSDQVDISFEYYMGKTGMISLGLFYKDMQDYIQKVTTVDPFPTPTNCIKATNPDQDTDENGCLLFEVSRPMNGPASIVKGAEFNFYKDLDFLPSYLANLSVKFNYTYSDSEAQLIDPDTGKEVAGATFPLEGLSQDTFNTTLAYEAESFFVRLSHNYRSEYLIQAFGPQENAQYRDAYGQLDMSASVNISKDIKLILQGVNITEQVTTSYLDQLPYWQQIGSTERLNAYNSTGRRYRISISGQF